MKPQRDYNPGPYDTAEEARTAFRHGILDPALAASSAYLLFRREHVLTMAIGRAGIETTAFEEACERSIAELLVPEAVQVIAGWITRAYHAGQLDHNPPNDDNDLPGGTR